MPIYEYLCHDCSYTFELKQSMKDEAVATCAKCGKSVSRIISAPAIMFKGSGWYITDYARKGAAGTGADKSDGAKTDATKTDAAKPSSGDTKSSPAGTASSASTPTSSTKDS